MAAGANILRKRSATVRFVLPVCGTIVGVLVAAGCVQSARKSDINSIRPLFATAQRWQFLPTSQAISAILTMPQLPDGGGAADEVVHAKEEEVRDRSRM